MSQQSENEAQKSFLESSCNLSFSYPLPRTTHSDVCNMRCVISTGIPIFEKCKRNVSDLKSRRNWKYSLMALKGCMKQPVLPVCEESCAEPDTNTPDIKKDTKKMLFLANLPFDKQAELCWEGLVVGKELGRGSFGVVRKALVAATGEQVAVKIMKTGKSDEITKKQIKAMEAELRVLIKLGTHERLVQLRGFGEIRASCDANFSDSVYIITELVPGGSLRNALLDYGAMNERLAAKKLGQIIEGLLFLHERCILHRDLKSDNVLLDLQGNCKLVDFGSSRLQEKDRDGQHLLIFSMHGSVPWMAPEIVNPKNGYDTKADIWSLGCLLIEMLTARRPWAKYDNIMTLAFKLSSTDELPEIPIHISEECRNLIQKCLVRNSASRINCKQLLQHPFVGPYTSYCPHSFE